MTAVGHMKPEHTPLVHAAASIGSFVPALSKGLIRIGPADPARSEHLFQADFSHTGHSLVWRSECSQLCQCLSVDLLRLMKRKEVRRVKLASF